MLAFGNTDLAASGDEWGGLWHSSSKTFLLGESVAFPPLSVAQHVPALREAAMKISNTDGIPGHVKNPAMCDVMSCHTISLRN